MSELGVGDGEGVVGPGQTRGERDLLKLSGGEMCSSCFGAKERGDRGGMSGGAAEEASRSE